MSKLPPPNAGIPLQLDVGVPHPTWYTWFTQLGAATGQVPLEVNFGPTAATVLTPDQRQKLKVFLGKLSQVPAVSRPTIEPSGM